MLRLNLADGEPFALVTVWLPAAVGDHVSRADVERATFFELLPLQGVEAGRVVQTIIARRGRRHRGPPARRPHRRPAARVPEGHLRSHAAPRSWSRSTGIPPSRPLSRSSFPPPTSLESPMAEVVEPNTPIELVRAAYEKYPERTDDRPPPARTAAHLRREDARRPRRRSRDGRASTGASTTATTARTASRCRTPPRRWRCSSSRWPTCRRSRCRRTVHCDHLIQAARRCRGRHAHRARRELRGVRVPADGEREVRHRVLEAGLGHHPPGRPRELRVPRRHDDRHRQPHAERRGPRDDRDRRRWCRCGRRDGRLAVQHAGPEAHRRQAHRASSRAGPRRRTSS